MYQYKGQGRIFEKYGTKISKKNNLKQKSYEDFSVLKINKSTKNLMILEKSTKCIINLTLFFSKLIGKRVGTLIYNVQTR